MPRRTLFLLVAIATALTISDRVLSQDVLHIPLLEKAPVIDADLADWKHQGFNDGIWDIHRIRHQPWYEEGRRNRLTDQGDEPDIDEDLQARYYTAWDSDNFYFGAEVKDNRNDIDDPDHAPHRWMFKDSICWFIEAPRDRAPERFGRGDNAFCFVIDDRHPDYGAWWRYGTPDASYQETPIPSDAVEWRVIVDPEESGSGDFVLEARVNMSATLPISDPDWSPPHVGDEYGMEIVHCDPDGGGYGGHYMIYGTGDTDTTWGQMVLVGPQAPIERLAK